MRPILFAAVVGLGGVALLIALGVWQVQRLDWKRGVLAEIEARIAADPVALPAAPDPVADRYLPVAVEGRYLGRPLRVLIGRAGSGAGWRLVQAFETGEGRRILVDRGVIPAGGAALPGEAPGRVVGNLLWPDEVDRFTPAPDVDGNIWYARDLPGMARQLGTEPVLVVARSATGEGIAPLPVSTEGIPDNHLQYAITWFSLAVVWAGMTGLWLWRIRRGRGEEGA